MCRIAHQDGSLQPQFSDRTLAPSTARSLRRFVLQLHADIWFSGCAIFWRVPTRPTTWACYLVSYIKFCFRADDEDDDEDDDGGMLGICTLRPHGFKKYGHSFASACFEWRHAWIWKYRNTRMFYDTLHSSCIAKPKKCENLYNVKLPSGFWSLYLEGVPKMKHIYTTDIIYIYIHLHLHTRKIWIYQVSIYTYIFFIYVS